jgi:hypothetical protein
MSTLGDHNACHMSTAGIMSTAGTVPTAGDLNDRHMLTAGDHNNRQMLTAGDHNNHHMSTAGDARHMAPAGLVLDGCAFGWYLREAAEDSTVEGIEEGRSVLEGIDAKVAGVTLQVAPGEMVIVYGKVSRRDGLGFRVLG